MKRVGEREQEIERSLQYYTIPHHGTVQKQITLPYHTLHFKHWDSWFFKFLRILKSSRNISKKCSASQQNKIK